MHDTLVIGGGISGISFAHACAAAGGQPLLLEAAPRLGGCIHTERAPAGYWFEMGAHTAYNSYRGLLEIIESCGLREKLLPRAKVPFRLLQDGALRSIVKELSIAEVLASVPRALGNHKGGQTVYSYYSRLVGRRNYARVLGPFLAAVPSQSADAFPASMLFKTRRRRKDVWRSFTIEGGLQTVVDGAAARPGVTARTGVAVERVERAGTGFEVRTASGERLAARQVAVAVPPAVAARLLSDGFPELSAQLSRIATAMVDTVGVVVPREKVRFEPVAGIVPRDDLFWSAVTRDTVPDPRHRAFAFHFKPGHSPEEKLRRVGEVLSVAPAEFEAVAEATRQLPSPVLGHETLVAEIDRLIAGTPLALTGNYFAGLSLEDCVSRSTTEWARMAAL